MTESLSADVPVAAFDKAIAALDEYDKLVVQFEMLIDTQQLLVDTADFAGLFEMVLRGDKLARDAAICGRRITPLSSALASGQFTGPRAAELRRRGVVAIKRATTLDAATARLANACAKVRDVIGREIRQSLTPDPQAGLPPAFRGANHFLNRTA